MTTELPETKTLALRLDDGVLHLTFDRPKARNAMSFAMVDEIESVLDAVAEDREIRVIVLRGAEGNFCAGGDIKDMAAARMAGAPKDGEPDPLALGNRRFGTMIEKLDAAPQAVVAVAEGAVMGGGFGVMCVTDYAIAVEGASLRLPETSLGIPPAQIAPFIVRRVGLTQARRLAVTGGRLDAAQATALGITHEHVADEAALQDALANILGQIRRCAPAAVATTKQLMRAAVTEPLSHVLDQGATAFGEAARGPEGVEGMTAFIEKRKPRWAGA